MLNYLNSLLLLMVSCVHGFSSLTRMPQPMPGFQQQKTFGQWFTAYVNPPCSWTSRTNQNPFYTSGGKNILKIRLSWQKDEFCNMVTLKKIMISPGVYLMEDGIGGMVSGKSIVVATDYTRSLILWGCTQFAVIGDECEKPYAGVMTRSPHPDALTMAMVNAKLKSLWGITVNDMRKVVHTGACYYRDRIGSFYKGK